MRKSFVFLMLKVTYGHGSGAFRCCRENIAKLMSIIHLDKPLSWAELAGVARGELQLRSSPAALARLEAANALVRQIVAKQIPAYGISTGVGALSDTVIPRQDQSILSRNILMSHAVGVGTPLGAEETRAIIAAAINNYCHGYSGLTPALVERLIALLAHDCLPEVPRNGSVGYLSHMAHIGLVLIGQGYAWLKGERLSGAAALARLELAPLTLAAKDGLSLVNGTPCATGLACLAMERSQRLMEWADAIAAMSFEALRCQISAITAPAVGLRASPGLQHVAASIQAYLAGSPAIAGAAGRRVQDALSLRAIPHVHGAVRDSWQAIGQVVDDELRSVTDNPAVAGTPEAPEVYSEAHAVGAALSLSMDQLAIAMAQLGVISERRLDRLVNPLVSGLPPFLAVGSGVASGFMIAQYSATSLVAENRRLAAPASLGGGITSGLQEDMLCHATPAALKVLDLLGNVRDILAIEYLAAAQSFDMMGTPPAPRTGGLHARLRQIIAPYADDRPLAEDIASAAALIERHAPGSLSAA